MRSVTCQDVLKVAISALLLGGELLEYLAKNRVGVLVMLSGHFIVMVHQAWLRRSEFFGERPAFRAGSQSKCDATSQGGRGSLGAMAILRPPYIGNTTGTSSTVTSSTRIVKGTPTFTKSKNLYWPGPSTRMFTGEEIGVMNAAEAARATVIAKG